MLTWRDPDQVETPKRAIRVMMVKSILEYQDEWSRQDEWMTSEGTTRYWMYRDDCG